MKKFTKLTLIASAFAAVLTLGACSDGEGAVTGTKIDFTPGSSVSASDVLVDYAADVVVDRYENLADKSKALYDAVCEIDGATSTPDAFSAACDAWKEARIAWERTEAYLFGPVDSYGIDPGIDSWPLGMATLATFIKTCATSADSGAAAIQKDNGDKKGFHAIEFMLFDAGKAKTTWNQFDSAYSSYGFSDLTDEQIQGYMEAVTEEIYRCTAILIAEWQGEIGDYSDIISSSDITGNNYTTDFTTAGTKATSSYNSIEDALSIIMESAAGIADEVGAVKIADPINSGNPLDVESWFSYNSVTDFTNNIVGIKEAYYGMQYSDTDYFNSDAAAENSISAYIASGDASLDLKIRTAISNAITFVNNMSAPFRSNLVWDAANTMAAKSCLELVETLEMGQSAVANGYYIVY